MPLDKLAPGGGGSSGPRPLGQATSLRPLGRKQAETNGEDSGGVNVGAVAAGGATLAGIVALASKLKNGSGVLGAVGKGAAGLNALRQQLMLSGFAVPKSILGNVGSGIEQVAEGNGFGALKHLFSGQTIKDAAKSYASGSGAISNPAGVGAVTQSTNPLVRAASYLAPGRVMGAMDEATQAAHVRSGANAAEAASRTLQAPLPPQLAGALDSPTARYIHPFRRTPFNQFLEGWQKAKAAHNGDSAARRGMAVYGTAGAVHGAATADDQTPMSVPLAIAGSARYGLPYGLAVLAGRTLAGGKTSGSGAAGSILPVSEYGVESSFDVTKPFKKPAAITAMERMFGGG